MPDNEKTILIVDDEEEVRDWIGSFLESMGYKVLKAASGRESIDIIKANNPDLVFLDVRMPKMSGIEVLAELKNNNISANVYLVTAADEDDLKEARALGIRGVLNKPINIKELSAIVKDNVAK